MYYYFVYGDIQDIELVAAKRGLQGRILNKHDGYIMILKEKIKNEDNIRIGYEERINEQ